MIGGERRKMRKSILVVLAVIVILVVSALVWAFWMGKAENYATIQAVVYGKDGSVKTITSRSLSPMEVKFEGVLIDRVLFTLGGHVKYTGTVKSVQCEASMSFDLEGDGTAEETESHHGDLVLKVPFTYFLWPLVSFNITEAQIQSWATETKTYTAKVTGTASLDITFTDGAVSHLESAGSVSATFQLEVSKSGATALTLIIQSSSWQATS